MLARPLVEAGVLTLDDWRYGQDPAGLLAEAWKRGIRTAMRDAPNGMEVHLGLEPWSMLLEGMQEEIHPSDHAQLAVTIDASECVVVEVDKLRAKWGETAAGVIATALRAGLGRVINVWDPDDLEWVADWWHDRLDMFAVEDGEEENPEDAEDRKFEERRIQEFAATQEFIRQSYLRDTTRTALTDALKTLPAGPIRRSVAALLTTKRQPRSLWPSRALERMKSTEDGYPTAAVLITRSFDDPVRHAYDEVQESTMNSGYSSPEHGVILLDTRSPARLALSLRQLQRVLRTLAWGEHLVHAILDLQDP